MTSPAAKDPYVTAFEATVSDVDGNRVVLDATYFYAEGGGQPADRGTIGGVDVVDVQTRDGEIVHELAADPPFDPGDAVESTVDPDFRTYCMRAHTASHVLYGAGRRLLSDLGYGGFDISPEKVRVDFSTTTDVDDETLVGLERLANRAVWDSHAVSWEELPEEEALAREGVAFNASTEEGIADDAVRIVTIEDWDVAACGGTHVENTREIGPIAVLSRSNPGEGLTRVEFAVGPEAIDARATDRERAMWAARLLSTSVDGLPDAIDRLRTERDEFRAELDALRESMVNDRIAELREDAVRRDGATWVVGALPGDFDAGTLTERASEAASNGEAIDVVALVSGDGRYVAVATGGDVDAESTVAEVTEAFGGGGGGGPTVAQGGGLDASAEEVVAFLRRSS